MNSPTVNRFLFFSCVFVTLLCAAQADERTDAAIAASKVWLELVDQGEYKRSWQDAAPFFQEHVKESQWESLISSVRNPLGAVESRELISAHYTTTLPGAPDGNYVVVQFKTSYANKPEAVETVTPMLINDTWRVSGYFIK